MGWQVYNAASIVKFAPKDEEGSERSAQLLNYEISAGAPPITSCKHHIRIDHRCRLQILVHIRQMLALDIKGACSDARAIASPIADADLHRMPCREWVCEIWQHLRDVV